MRRDARAVGLRTLMEGLTSDEDVTRQFGPAPLIQLWDLWNKVDPRYLTLHLQSAEGIPAMDGPGAATDAYAVAYLVPPESPSAEVCEAAAAVIAAAGLAEDPEEAAAVAAAEEEAAIVAAAEETSALAEGFNAAAAASGSGGSGAEDEEGGVSVVVVLLMLALLAGLMAAVVFVMYKATQVGKAERELEARHAEQKSVVMSEKKSLYATSAAAKA